MGASANDAARTSAVIFFILVTPYTNLFQVIKISVLIKPVTAT